MIDIMTSVVVLNQARESELLSIQQYMRFYYALEDAQYAQLAKNMKEIAISEMRHAEYLSERIIELKGTPSQRLGGDVQTFTGGTDALASMYDRARQLEETAEEIYTQGIAVLRNAEDFTSEKLFKAILAEEVQHEQYFQAIAAFIADNGPSFAAVQANSKYKAADYARYVGVK